MCDGSGKDRWRPMTPAQVAQSMVGEIPSDLLAAAHRTVTEGLGREKPDLRNSLEVARLIDKLQRQGKTVTITCTARQLRRLCPSIRLDWEDVDIVVRPEKGDYPRDDEDFLKSKK